MHHPAAITYHSMEYDEADYFNDDQRDVHVWCSEASTSWTLGLVAGCCTHGKLQVNVFFEWLAMLIEAQNNVSDGDLVLGRCDRDPRTQVLSTEMSVPSTDDILRQNSTSLLEPGHYAIFKYSRRKLTTIYVDVKELLCSSKHMANRDQTNTASAGPGSSRNNPSGRSSVTRKEVRRRDKKCVITGESARRRNRGYNFTGLEVAHIYPLAYAGDADALMQVSSQALDYVKDFGSADTPNNAMLLRADIHSLFDDYQFGIWPKDGRLYRFEKDGAPAIGRLPSDQVSPELLSLNANSVSSRLLTEHFRICLSWHVRNNGRRRDSGSLVDL